jgi:hypothetical protein
VACAGGPQGKSVERRRAAIFKQITASSAAWPAAAAKAASQLASVVQTNALAAKLGTTLGATLPALGQTPTILRPQRGGFDLCQVAVELLEGPVRIRLDNPFGPTKGREGNSLP